MLNKFLSRNSALEFPSLDKERGSRGNSPRRGGSNGWESPRQQLDSSNHTTPVALRATSPPQLRRGVLLRSSEFRDKTRILFSFSHSRPSPRPSPRARVEGEGFLVTFTQGGASLALGYSLTPSNGACNEEGPFIRLLAPDSFW